MSWSYRIASWRGIDLKVHATFVLILLLAAAHWSGRGPAGMAFGVLLMLLLFACVALHEFGHALAAQRYGIGVREIVLLPIGGVALLSRNPSRAGQELVIAAAGPAVNVLIAVLLIVLLGFGVRAGDLDPRMLLTARGEPSAAAALIWLLEANIALVLFNMIPAFPLDGGRILRGLLGLVMDFGRATRIAALTGQTIAGALGLLGLMAGNLILTVIAVFVFFGASATYAEEQARTLLNTLRVGDAYNKHALTLRETDRLSRVVDYLLTSYQPDFAVLRGRRLAGVVSREQVLEAMSRFTGDPPVSEIMLRSIPEISHLLPLDEARRRMAEAGTRVAAVYDAHGYLGLVGVDDITEAQMILAFMGRRTATPGGPAWAASVVAPVCTVEVHEAGVPPRERP